MRYKPRLIHVGEPRLEFRFGQKTDYARDGLYLFGPVDAFDAPRQVRYGFIGTSDSYRRFGEWADRVSGYIDVPEPGRLAKATAPHHVPFPGFGEAFHSLWSKKPVRAITDLNEKELRRLICIENRHEAIKAVVDVFVDRLVSDQKRSEDPPSFWYVAIPDFVFEMGRPNSTVAPADRIKGKVRISERKAAALTVQPTLFGIAEKEAEVYKYAKNFRRQLKARLLDHQIVIQIVRESTLTPDEFVKANGKDPKRRVEDPATIAWKLCTGSYYKSGGRPWQLGDIRPGVCYVGLVYKKQPESTDPRYACCAAQMFLSDGEGVVFRGALGPWFHPDSKQFHLDRQSARRLIETVLAEYRLKHQADPEELFVHAKASFSDDEWQGFSEVSTGKTRVVGVQIADAWDQLKLFRPGAYPVVRGTALITGPRSGFLWTTGYVPRLDTYMGPETPNPLAVSVRRGDADIETVMSDVLALSKINFNTCLFNDREPVTIKFADAIGDILTAAPLSSEPRLPFKFYI
jgi:hypothetical protein